MSELLPVETPSLREDSSGLQSRVQANRGKDYKSVALKTEDEEYILALKQELRETMKIMPYFIETPEEGQDIERYSKRYMKKGDGEKSDEENEEKEGSKEKSKGDDDDDDDAADEEEYDEDEQEEENDYINSYFEDGDDFGTDSDDNMGEATY
ncbi:hypothetical protein H8958_009520 [Nasalis larvatus]